MLKQQAIKRWRGLLFSLGLLSLSALAAVLLAAPAHGQVAHERKLISRVEPDYPDALKRLYIGGTVKIEAVVAPDGTVESTQMIGGNPILGQTAMRAIKEWKYTRANSKETLVVKLEFDPHR